MSLQEVLRQPTLEELKDQENRNNQIKKLFNQYEGRKLKVISSVLGSSDVILEGYFSTSQHGQSYGYKKSKQSKKKDLKNYNAVKAIYYRNKLIFGDDE